MFSNKYQLENHRKYLLNRLTASSNFTEYIDYCLIKEEEAAQHTFHKIMVHSWQDSFEALCDTLADYFSTAFIPVNATTQSNVTTFYTCSLNFISKIVKLDFMFPYKRHMFNVDVLFNDKTSADCFENRMTIEEIVSGIVSNRFNEKFELDLSDFCNDRELLNKKINFYKLSLLANFKILMIRMAKDTKLLNLSNNKLSLIPSDILNFFIKGDLTGVNLSNNELPSLAELQRVSSKIERLWVEGNPLCEELDSLTYVKSLVKKFPRLMELDGIKLNQHGLTFPFIKYFIATPNVLTKMLVDKFITLYFAHYDRTPRKSTGGFYSENATLTIATNFTDKEEDVMPHYKNFSRNILHPYKRLHTLNNKKVYGHTKKIISHHVFSQIPQTVHDPHTFTVDVLKHDDDELILIVDGIFKEITTIGPKITRHIHFRRVFFLERSFTEDEPLCFKIKREAITLSNATDEQIENSFKRPIFNLNMLTLVDPDHEEAEALCNILTHVTQLQKHEAMLRLRTNQWDIRKTLVEFNTDMRNNAILPESFLQVDEFSDTSSMYDDLDDIE